MSYIGRVIKGRYKIYDKVGSGGMATVYLARDLETNEVVAVKILREELTEEKKYVERFLREAETALKLKHPNITQVKDFGRDGDIYYIVMEYVQGKTLEEIVDKKGALSEEEVIRIGIEVAKALDYSYKHGVIAHRDIKPQNIMISKDGNVKVMDFGVAKVSNVSTITSQGSIIGTPYYISPEQAKGKPSDIRSDLYSLGVTLYRLITGRVPFDAETPWSVVNMHITTPPPPIEEVRRDVSEDLRRIIYKLLNKDPKKRYQTPEELIKDLEKIKKKEKFTKTVVLPEKEEKEERVFSIEEKTVILPEKEGTIVLPSKEIEEKKKTKIFEKIREVGKNIKVRNLKTIIVVILVASLSLIPIFLFLSRRGKPTTNQSYNPPGGNTTTNTNQNNQNQRNNENPIIITDYATLIVNSEPEGAQIFLNGKNTGFITPKTIKNLKPGKYTLVLVLEGYMEEKREIELKKNESLTLSITLKKEIEEINVSINSSPSGAKIIVDGEDTGKKTPANVKLKIGEHTVKLTLKGYEDLVKKIKVEKDGESFNFTLRRIETKAETGIIYISSNPKGAEVYIDGVKKGTTPIRLSLKEGMHKITLRKEGYRDYTKDVKIEGGKEIKLSVNLNKITYGVLTIQTKPQGAEIYIDGKDTGKKTPYTFKLPTGKHKILVKLKNYKDYSQTVNVKENEPTVLNINLEPKVKTITYSDDEGLYSLTYPSTWVIMENPDETTDLEIDSPEFEDGYVASCFIYFDKLEEIGLSYEEAIESTKEGLEDSGLKIADEGKETIGGKDFYKVVYEGKSTDVEGNIINIKGSIFFIEKDGILFYIELAATKEDFDKAWDDFITIVSSFKPLP